MSEWLDLMLEEIERKKKERDEALAERARRSDESGSQQQAPTDDAADQSK